MNNVIFKTCRCTSVNYKGRGFTPKCCRRCSSNVNKRAFKPKYAGVYEGVGYPSPLGLVVDL